MVPVVMLMLVAVGHLGLEVPQPSSADDSQPNLMPGRLAV